MGYNTYYSLEVKNVKSEDDYQKLLEVMTNCRTYNHQMIFDYALDSDGYYSGDTVWFDGCGSTKWYDHDEDMLAVSKALPEMTFKLNGEGEEQGDFWFCLYKDGKSDQCNGRIVYEEPQEIEW